MSESDKIINEIVSPNLIQSYNDLNIPIAFADKTKSIVWASIKFKELIDSDVENHDFTKLFNINLPGIKGSNSYTEDNLFWSLNIIYREQEENKSHYVLFLKEKYESSEKMLMQVKGIKSFAHDLNNILTSITNSSALLKNQTAARIETTKLIDNIEANAHRAADIIHQVLTDGLNQKTIKKKIDLKLLLGELYNSLQSVLSDKIEFELNVPEDLHNITANYSDIYRILLNLCMNASEAIRNKGKITVAASNLSGNKLSLTGVIKSKQIVKISVTDNGSGIRKKNISKIFTPGFSTKNRLRDSGLGLHIVKNLIEDHSGKIEVNSKWLRGTEFNIYLPARELYESSKLASSENRTILIADDEESILELLCDLLESYNYNVVSAINGEEVLKAYKKNRNIDMMIIDRKMPILDGLESIRQLRDMNYTNPIILTTGSQSSKKELNPEDISVEKVMIKPYDFEQLLVEVKALLT